MDDIFRYRVHLPLDGGETGDGAGVFQMRACARNIDNIVDFALLDRRRCDGAQFAVISGDVRMRKTGRRYPERGLGAPENLSHRIDISQRSLMNFDPAAYGIGEFFRLANDDGDLRSGLEKLL